MDFQINQISIRMLEYLWKYTDKRKQKFTNIPNFKSASNFRFNVANLQRLLIKP